MKTKGFFYGLISSATFGLIPLFSIPALEGGVGLDSLLFYRFSLATVLVGVIMLIKKKDFRLQGAEIGMLFLLGAFYAVTALLLTQSYLYIPSGIATTIHFLYPVMVSLFMFLFFKDKLTLPILLAMILAIGGVYMLSAGEENGAEGSIRWKGFLLVLITIFTYAAYIVGMNRSRLAQMDSLKATFYILAAGAFIFLLNLAVKRQMLDPLPTARIAIDVLLVAFLPTLISDLTLILAIRSIGSISTAILGCMEPLTAVCMGVLFLGEHVSTVQTAGIFVVLTAVCIVIASSWIRKGIRLFFHFLQYTLSRIR